ncbi:kinase-like protein, partial [Backusella circina FSU 941]
MRFHASGIIFEEPQQQQGAFTKLNSFTDLPMSHFRAREKKKYGPLYMLTSELQTTYHACNQGFKYNTTNNPRRVLTKPSKACKNDGYDNEDFDYILYVNDVLGGAEGHKYLILDILGSGAFGQVVKCRNLKTQEVVAVKVVKNKPAYFKQSMMEVAILEMLNHRYDPDDKHHLLRLRDTFVHKKHLCLVFELLSVNLYELIKQNHFRGLSTNLVRVFTAQLLDALTVMNEARIIHCDLKPENVLLKNLESPTIKVIDFGSACHEVQTMYTYIQSRFYRSPEVLIGLPYTSAIDMWSLGCIAAELFLGLPLFPGSSEYNQLSRIIEILGTPPNYMVEVGKNAHRYFDKEPIGDRKYRFKSLDEYSQEQGRVEQPSKRYFAAKTLPDLINNYPIMRKTQMTTKEIEKEKQNRLAFIDFLQGLLNLNPIERWSPQQAKQHPFITGEKFIRPFRPPFILPKQTHVVPQQPSPSTSSSTSQFGRPQTYSDSFLSPAYSSLPTHYESESSRMTKRSSYIPPLPSVLEPQHIYQQEQYQPSSSVPLSFQPSQNQHHGPISMLEISTNHHPQQQQHLPHHNDLNIPQVNARPRANTVGNAQAHLPPPPAPSSLQWDNESGKDTSLYYQHFGQPHQQQAYSGFTPGGGTFNGNSGLNKRDSFIIEEDVPRWSSRQTLDLERDGGVDWQQEPLVPPRKANYHHRRSNSHYSTTTNTLPIAMSNPHSRSSSFHRFMRGHTIPHTRQDLEWDGVIHSPPAPIKSNSTQSIDDNRRWSKEHAGWM